MVLVVINHSDIIIWNQIRTECILLYKASNLILVKSEEVDKNELILYNNIDGGESYLILGHTFDIINK